MNPRGHVAILALGFCGCSASLSGSYILPESPSRPTAEARFPGETLYVPTVSLKQFPRTELDDEWKDQRERLRVRLTDLLVAHLDKLGIFGRVAHAQGGLQPGEHNAVLDVEMSDWFERNFKYAVLFMWRHDTYHVRLQATLRLGNGKFIASYDEKQITDCGLSHFWFIDIFIPLIPFYISSNEDERAAGLNQLLENFAARFQADGATVARSLADFRKGPGQQPTLASRSFPGKTQPGKQRIVAVMPIDDTTGMRATTVESLTDYLRAMLAETGKFTVVEKGQQESTLQRLIKEQQKASYQACVDDACQIPLGRELAADCVLRTKLSRVGETYLITAEVIDLMKAAAVQSVAAKSPPGEDNILEAIERVARDLTH